MAKMSLTAQNGSKRLKMGQNGSKIELAMVDAGEVLVAALNQIAKMVIFLEKAKTQF